MAEPIEQAARAYEGWQELAWNVRVLAENVKAMEAKVESLVSADVQQLKLHLGWLQKDVENIKTTQEQKTGDGRWMIGTALGILALIASIVMPLLKK